MKNMGKKYSELRELNENSRNILKSRVQEIINELKEIDYRKFLKVMNNIKDILKITYESKKHQQQRPKTGNNKGQHPIKPIRGQIYNAILGENAGSELSGEHPVIVIQNDTGNLFAQKVIVLPIEGDGHTINEAYMMRITSEDLEGDKRLRKEPSRAIISEILTIDKARLGFKIGRLKSEKIKELNKKIYNQLSLDKY